ncbi:MAG: NAD-dependent epimerase/dehydratase family protein [Acidimicrobiia bacterium]
MGRRVLVTGLGTFWGSRLAQALEARDDVELIVGVDGRAPRVPLSRTEFVKADPSFAILQRVVRATHIDTVLHTHLQADSTQSSPRRLHETNVIGTMNLLAAAAAPDSRVRKVVVKTATLVYGSHFDDPYFFREDARRTHVPVTPVERSLVEVDGLLRDFADDNPDVVTTRLRFANILGDDVSTLFSRLLRMRAAPEILGFDPRLQFVHEDDVTRALEFAVTHDIPGTFNVAGPGTITWSETCDLAGRRRIALPPVLTKPAALPLRMLRITDLAPETLALLRYGRGVDTDKLRAAGFEYRYDTRATVEAFAEARRLERVVGTPDPYVYEHDVEEFFRHSHAVVRSDPSSSGGEG